MHHAAGDIVAGRVLGADGQWYPIAAPEDRGRKQRGRLRRRLALTGAGVALLAGVAGADIALSHREMTTLLDRIAASEKAMLDGQTEINAIPVPDLFPVTGATQANAEAFTRTVQAACGDAMANVQQAGDRLEDVTLLPWHRSLASAKTRYLEHNEVWHRYYSRCATDITAIGDSSQKADIRATFKTAALAVTAAEPLFADNSQRIDSLFKDAR